MKEFLRFAEQNKGTILKGVLGWGCVLEQLMNTVNMSLLFSTVILVDLLVPTSHPDIDTPCPTDASWVSFGSYCYLFPSTEAQWGEANFK